MAEHAHHEESFISKYIFSQDHKMISKQFLVTAMAMGIVAVMLSVFSACNWVGQERVLPFWKRSWANGPPEGCWTETHTWRS